MLFLISPAKTLDYETPVPASLRRKATEPLYTAQAAVLIERLRQLGVADVAALMDLSTELATLNVERYAAWSPEATARNSRPAAWAFDGDVYDGLSARTLGTADWTWAQAHLVILSGLYGLLRPLDRLQPYRLEMGTRLANPRGRDLYAFWGDLPAQTLNALFENEARPVLVNLASDEYFKSVRRKVLKAEVIQPVFQDWKGGGYKVISFFAKRARGLMARYAAEQGIDQPEALRDFAVDGYALAPEVSSATEWVFRRRLD